MPESMPANRWSIIVHGGAKPIEQDEAGAYRAGCEQATEAGLTVLARGGTAIDAVVAAIRVLEDDPTFNAGTGAVRNRDGDVELDAAIMDGRTLDVGGVAALRDATNPILAAHAMLRLEETLIVGEGARHFAENFAPQSIGNHAASGATANGGDTVGCVAFDRSGDIAAGTSTGGLDGSRPGRVGDSPVPGCGLFAENGLGGVALSGAGERISRVTLAAWTMARLQNNSASEVAEASISRLERVGGEGGVILIDAAGNVAWAHNSRDFAVAYATHDHSLDSFTRSPRPRVERSQQ